MPRPTIEIHGTGTGNRGAELMAMAIADRLRADLPGVRLVVPPGFGDFESRARHGFWTTWEVPGRFRGRLRRLALRAGAAADRELVGLVDPNEIDAVLDASGFAFSDYWGPTPAMSLATHMTLHTRAKKPLVLLPQAFGPFCDSDTAQAMRSLGARSSLVCARDPESFRFLVDLGIPKERLRLFPDFTVGIRPRFSEEVNTPKDFVAVVPNIRMTDKTTQASKYLEFLSRTMSELRDRHLVPLLVIHDANEDQDLVQQLYEGPASVEKILHRDPRVLKGILGRAQFVIGSRYHALVGALSQGVPCIGLGWAHKYPNLFADFDCRELLVSGWSESHRLAALIEQLADPAVRESWRVRLLDAGERLKSTTEEMWRELVRFIRNQQTIRG